MRKPESLVRVNTNEREKERERERRKERFVKTWNSYPAARSSRRNTFLTSTYFSLFVYARSINWQKCRQVRKSPAVDGLLIERTWMLAVNESARNISWEVTRANLRVPVEGDIFIARYFHCAISPPLDSSRGDTHCRRGRRSQLRNFGRGKMSYRIGPWGEEGYF